MTAQTANLKILNSLTGHSDVTVQVGGEEERKETKSLIRTLQQGKCSIFIGIGDDTRNVVDYDERTNEWVLRKLEKSEAKAWKKRTGEEAPNRISAAANIDIVVVAPVAGG